MNDDDLNARLKFEQEKWSGYFEAALEGEGQEHDNTLWWRVSDDHSLDIVEEFLGTTNSLSVCEPACGSGGTSLKLTERFDLNELLLTDVSPSAVDFARSLVPPELKDISKVEIGNAFDLDVADNKFDLVWNVGVIEHYLEDQILRMVGEMLRIAKPGGVVIVAFPNRKAMATLKAALLGSRFGRRFLGAISGYRFDTEILYGDQHLAKLFETEFGVPVSVRHAGSLWWVNAPPALVSLEQKWIPRSRFAFLTFLIIRKPRA